MNDNDETKYYNELKYFNREQKLFDKFSDTVDFSGYPLNQRLHKKHEFYLNERKRVHTSNDLRLYEYLDKKEKRDLKKAEKLERKKQKKAKKNEMIEKTVGKKPAVLKEKSNHHIQEAKIEEMSDNEFKIDEKTKELLEISKSKKIAAENNESQMNKKKDKELRAILEKQELVERKSKIEKFIRLLNNHTIDDKFLVKSLNKVPFLPKQMILGNKDLYLQSEIQLSEAKLFEDTQEIHSSKLIPSISNIIQLAYPLSENLLKWKMEKIQTLGKEGFDIYTQKIKNEGKQFHSYVENRLLNKPTVRYDKNLEALEPIFGSIGPVLLTEAAVQHSNLFYQGRIDCLAYYKNELCLIDWKTSEKSKPGMRDLFDLPVQISAYIGAFLSDPRYEQLRKTHQIKKGLLINFNKINGEVNIHHINYNLSELYWYKWLNYLRDFWIFILKNKSEQ